MSENTPCIHAGDSRLIFPCSGAADVGEIADRTARLISREGNGKMCCLAAIVVGFEEALATAQAAEKILAIDGCTGDCAKKALELAGFTTFQHLRVTDLGLVKGHTPVTMERVRAAAMRGAGLLRAGAQAHAV